MRGHEIARFPPILQLVALGLLGAYVGLSILGRLGRRFRWLWSDPEEARSLEHVVEYTVVPALVFFTAAVAVFLRWDRHAPLHGFWTLRELTLGPAAALIGVILIVAGTLAGRRSGAAAASTPSAWIPLISILLGIALLAVGVTSIGRAVKRSRGVVGQQAPIPEARLCRG